MVHRGKLPGIAFVSWMVFITVMSLVSFDDDTSLGLNIPYFDKIVHLAFYLIAGILASLYLQSDKTGEGGRKARRIKFLLGLIGYGIIIEVLQGSLTTYRSAEILDVLANSAGALLGIGSMWVLNTKRAGTN